MNVTVETVSDVLVVNCPFSSLFIKRVKGLGGARRDGVWKFNPSHEKVIREACVEAFGTDGTRPADLVSVRLQLPTAAGAPRQQLEAFGRHLYRVAREGTALRVGLGVALEKGSFAVLDVGPNWRVTTEGVTLLVRDVPRRLAEKALANGGADVGMGVGGLAPLELLASCESLRRTALAAERVGLIERLAQIDEDLGESSQWGSIDAGFCLIYASGSELEPDRFAKAVQECRRCGSPTVHVVDRGGFFVCLAEDEMLAAASALGLTPIVQVLVDACPLNQVAAVAGSGYQTAGALADSIYAANHCLYRFPRVVLREGIGS